MQGWKHPSCAVRVARFCLWLSTLKCRASCHVIRLLRFCQGLWCVKLTLLGGEMAKTIDKTYPDDAQQGKVQLFMPFVRRLIRSFNLRRCKTVENQENLTRQTMIDDFVEDAAVVGVRTATHQEYAKAIVTTNCPPWGNHHRTPSTVRTKS